jgi:hypothetical protein
MGKVVLSVVHNISLHYEDVWGIGGVSPYILNVYARWKWTVGLVPQLLYPWCKNPIKLLYSLNGLQIYYVW